MYSKGTHVVPRRLTRNIALKTQSTTMKTNSEVGSSAMHTMKIELMMMLAKITRSNFLFFTIVAAHSRHDFGLFASASVRASGSPSARGASPGRYFPSLKVPASFSGVSGTYSLSLKFGLASLASWSEEWSSEPSTCVGEPNGMRAKIPESIIPASGRSSTVDYPAILYKGVI